MRAVSKQSLLAVTAKPGGGHGMRGGSGGGRGHSGGGSGSGSGRGGGGSGGRGHTTRAHVGGHPGGPSKGVTFGESPSNSHTSSSSSSSSSGGRGGSENEVDGSGAKSEEILAGEERSIVIAAALKEHEVRAYISLITCVSVGFTCESLKCFLCFRLFKLSCYAEA